MPGPKMGPRPADFSEELVRHSPTFVKWEGMQVGEKLRYACRDFIKGHDQDEERLMRRIMIARRNNLRDHAILKQARKKQDEPAEEKTDESASTATGGIMTTQRKRRPASSFSDSQVAREMDVAAVEATRSYRAWMALPDGAEFVYNQKYYKGRPNQDWLLRKNIWRRMRYRRENKKLVTRLREDDPSISTPSEQPVEQQAASQIVDQALSPSLSQPEESAVLSNPPIVAAGEDPASTLHAQEVSGTKRCAEGDQALGTGQPTKMVKTEPTEMAHEQTSSDFSATAMQNPVLEQTVEVSLPALEEPSTISLPHAPSLLVDPDHHHVHHHHAPSSLSAATSTDDETAHAALTAAAAATASGAADDLVELSAVEAAVAAAASYVQLAHQDDDDEDEDDHHHDLDAHHQSVHNPLEAAANAAALDSAAKLAAAATAQEEVTAAAQQAAEEHAAAQQAAEEQARQESLVQPLAV